MPQQFYPSSSTAFALDSPAIQSSLSSLISAGSLPDATSIDQTTFDTLVRTLAGDPGVQAATTLTPRLVGDAVGRQFAVGTAPYAEIAPAVKAVEVELLRQPSTENAYALLRLMLPYLQNEGFCSGTAGSDEGVTCAMVYPGSSDAVSVSGFVGDQLQMKSVDNNSTLGKTLNVDGGAIGDLSNFVATLNGRVSGSGGGYYEGNASGFQIGVPYGFGYVFRYKCYTTCDVWGEAIAAADFQYLATGSDQAHALIPLGFHIGVGDTFNIYFEFVKNLVTGSKFKVQQIVEYVLRRGERRDFRLHSTGYIQQWRETICGIAEDAYQTNISYKILASGDTQVPYGEDFHFVFGTYYQYQATDTTVQRKHPGNYPIPTKALGLLDAGSYVGPIPLADYKAAGYDSQIPPIAEYDFSAVWTFKNDIIFGASEDANIYGTACSFRRAFKTANIDNAPAVVTGDHFWYTHLTEYPIGDRGLPEVDFAIGFQGGHKPYYLSPTN